MWRRQVRIDRNVWHSCKKMSQSFFRIVFQRVKNTYVTCKGPTWHILTLSCTVDLLFLFWHHIKCQHFPQLYWQMSRRFFFYGGVNLAVIPLYMSVWEMFCIEISICTVELRKPDHQLSHFQLPHCRKDKWAWLKCHNVSLKKLISWRYLMERVKTFSSTESFLNTQFCRKPQFCLNLAQESSGKLQQK